jgi:hypothetical protein
MSTVIAKNVQIGTSGTATDNFTIFQPATPDGTLRIGNGNTGITTSQVAVTSAGNVGIGTASPSFKLDVSGTGRFTGLTQFDNAINLKTATLNYVYFDDALAFSRNGTGERMRIDTSGNVGIGTSSPGNKLEVNGSFYQYNAYATLGNFNAGTSGTSPASNAALAVSNNITNGQAETDIWNTMDASTYANTGILFTQRLTSSTRRDLMFLHNNGNLQFNSGYGSVATAYGCRAWINFNGIGTPAIRGSGNFSSITDNGTGDYTLNFTTSLPDTNYCPVVGGDFSQGATRDNGMYLPTNFTFATSSLRISVTNYAGAYTDIDTVLVSIFR